MPSGYFAPSNIVKGAFKFATESKEKQNIPNNLKSGFSYPSKPWQQNGKVFCGRLTKNGSHSGDENCKSWSLHRKRRRFVAKMWRPERKKFLSTNLIFKSFLAKNRKKKNAILLITNSPAELDSRHYVKTPNWLIRNDRRSEPKCDHLHEELEISDCHPGKTFGKTKHTPPK